MNAYKFQNFVETKYSIEKQDLEQQWLKQIEKPYEMNERDNKIRTRRRNIEMVFLSNASSQVLVQAKNSNFCTFRLIVSSESNERYIHYDKAIKYE